MHHYSIFGACLRSGMPFPDLPVSGDRVARWTIARSDARPKATACELIGSFVEPPCEMTLSRTETGYRLHHACTADYDITASGDITCFPRPDVDDLQLQNDLTGRVMPVVLHGSGMLCLHGSGVLLGGKAVGFLADSGVGKSTLALALVRAGAPLITDDTFAVDLTSTAVVRPGIPQLRLRSDSSRRLSASSIPDRSKFDGKHIFGDFGPPRRVQSPMPLGALYVLAPVRAEPGDDEVRRELMPASRAVMALIQHAKIGMLLRGAEAPIVLERAIEVARQTPVYSLRVPRDFDRLDAVVAQLAHWHATGPLAAAC